MNDNPLRTSLAAAKEYTAFDFVKAAHNIINARSNDTITTEKLLSLLEQLENKHSELAMVKELLAIEPDVANRVIYYESCNDIMNNFDNGVSRISMTLDDIYDKTEMRARARKELLSEQHSLIVKGLMELRDNDEMTPTRKGLSLLFGELTDSICEPLAAKDRYEFVHNMYDLAEDMIRADSHGRKTIKTKLQKLEDENQGFSFIINLKKTVENFNYRLIFYMVADNLVQNRNYRMNELGDLFSTREQMEITRCFKDERTVLQARGLVTVSADGMFGYSEINMTDKGKELFLEEDAGLFAENVSGKDIIKHDDIDCKQLFFEKDLERQLERLSNSLENKNYHAMCERMKEKHLPTGVAVLLYGFPGTGKTESVLQIARKTGRDIMHVDISSTKSCWFGESEKLIKKVFEKYRSLCEKTKVKPILLFNEADGVFSKRKDSTRSNVAQTENAIQNIILEEMENLDGILIATTNLADNLDKAFERRFLFKVHFDKPTTEAKTNIWLDKLPSLDRANAERLAEQFDFSGGEIDNIARKAAMDEIVGGVTPSYESLLTLCKEERIAGQRNKRIGFV